MRIRSAGKRVDTIQLQTTPMIDIVFQLLVFFIMTFKIFLPEGDFFIRMPLHAAEGPVEDDPLPPMKVHLTAGPDGELTGIRLNDRPLSSFEDLSNELIALVGNDSGPGSAAESAEVELDCDYQLKYDYVMQAITSISGYVADGKIIRLVERIKFTPPKKEPEK